VAITFVKFKLPMPHAADTSGTLVDGATHVAPPARALHHAPQTGFAVVWPKQRCTENGGVGERMPQARAPKNALLVQCFNQCIMLIK
jgi:hypothetical protein